MGRAGAFEGLWGMEQESLDCQAPGGGHSPWCPLACRHTTSISTSIAPRAFLCLSPLLTGTIDIRGKASLTKVITL